MDNDISYVLIIGAGPAGLAAGYELIKLNNNLRPIIIDMLDQVGGLSRTIYTDKSGIDIGGHRLFTKNDYIESIWKEFLPLQSAPSADDIAANRSLSYPKDGCNPETNNDVLMIRKRFSSIINDNGKFSYPIKLNFQTFKKLGFKSSFLALSSYLKSLVFKETENNIECFLKNRFGEYLYKMFFKDHSTKIWGMNPSNLISNWDKKRVQNSLFLPSKLWEDEFYYPKFGCSQLWDKMADYIAQKGGKIILNCEFRNFIFDNSEIIGAKVFDNNSNSPYEIYAKHFISSIPISNLIKSFDAPTDIMRYALNLQYRDYILVSLFSKKFNLKNDTKYNTVNNIAPDNWIYLQKKGTISSRLQIMNNWSPYLIDNFRENYLISLEYFCNSNDDIWNWDDNKLVELAIADCQKYNFLNKTDIYNSKVIRVPYAYPVYSGTYKYINEIKQYLSKFNNLYLIGRNGKHEYINMDLAMVCGINIARDINEGYKNGK